MTKLGRLVKEGRIRSLEEIFLHSMPIKEHQIVDHFFPPVRSQCPLINSTPSTRLSPHATHRSVSQTAGKLKDEVMTIKPVQKQSSAGQRTYGSRRPNGPKKRYAHLLSLSGASRPTLRSAISMDILVSARSRTRCRNQQPPYRRRRALIFQFAQVF